ncbi:MAG: RHS repeat protein [Desulfofustis sp. PB-SRB1]|nr:RHS repeat protein [Desulfofustis sp. PB-SRB1]
MPNHQKQSYTDPAGRTRTLSYDEGGRPTGLDLGEAVGEVAITAYEWLRPPASCCPAAARLPSAITGCSSRQHRPVIPAATR